jgi:hypothetical protein
MLIYLNIFGSYFLLNFVGLTEKKIRIGRGLVPETKNAEGGVAVEIVRDAEAIKIGVIEVIEVIDTEVIEGGGIGKGRAVEAAKNQREIEKRRELTGR